MMIILERHQLLELEGLLSRLLCLKDSDFTKFLNNSEGMKPFFTYLQCFWSSASSLPADELSMSLHESFFKFLLRLCPSFNSKIPKPSKSEDKDNKQIPLKAVICSKKVIDCLFELDPIGLLCYLYETWNPSEFLNIIRDELIPNNILKHSGFNNNNNNNIMVNPECNEFIKWLTKNSFTGTLKSIERESIIKRFEYESDDDFFEDEDNKKDETCSDYDPLQIILFSTYISSPSVFSRTSSSRASKERTELLKKTKLAHEQVEGWAVMLERNFKKANVIQDFIIWSKSNNTQK